MCKCLEGWPIEPLFWIAVEGGGEPQKLEQGDCFLLPSGRPFLLASDLSLPKLSAEAVYAGGLHPTGICNGGGDFSLVGARFEFSGEQADALFDRLPAIGAARESSDQASVLRWSLTASAQVPDRAPRSRWAADRRFHSIEANRPGWQPYLFWLEPQASFSSPVPASWDRLTQYATVADTNTRCSENLPGSVMDWQLRLPFARWPPFG